MSDLDVDEFDELPTRPSLACPECHLAYAAVRALKHHLSTEHGKSAVDAWVIAQGVEKGIDIAARRREPESSPPPSPPPPISPAPVADAITPAVPDKEALSMPRPCGECGKVGHGRKQCPKALDKLVAGAAGKRAKPAKKEKPVKVTATKAPRTARRTPSVATTPTSGPMDARAACLVAFEGRRGQLNAEIAERQGELAKLDAVQRAIDEVFPPATSGGHA